MIDEMKRPKITLQNKHNLYDLINESTDGIETIVWNVKSMTLITTKRFIICLAELSNDNNNNDIKNCHTYLIQHENHHHANKCKHNDCKIIIILNLNIIQNYLYEQNIVDSVGNKTIELYLELSNNFGQTRSRPYRFSLMTKPAQNIDDSNIFYDHNDYSKISAKLYEHIRIIISSIIILIIMIIIGLFACHKHQRSIQEYNYQEFY